MIDILTALSPSLLTVAIKANLYTFFHSFRSSSKATVYDNVHGFRWNTAVVHPWFNGVLSTRPPAEDAVQIVGDALTYFRSRGVASFTWWLAPSLSQRPGCSSYWHRAFNMTTTRPAWP